jgi:hypothetical protein
MPRTRFAPAVRLISHVNLASLKAYLFLIGYIQAFESLGTSKDALPSVIEQQRFKFNVGTSPSLSPAARDGTDDVDIQYTKTVSSRQAKSYRQRLKIYSQASA